MDKINCMLYNISKYLPLFFVFIFCESYAQFWESNQTETVKKNVQLEKQDNLGSISSKVKNCDRFDGLFTIFRDRVNGKMFLLIEKNH